MAKIDFSEVVEREEREVETKEGVDRFPAHQNIAQIKHLRGEKELTYKEIGLIMGVTKQAIAHLCETRNITKGGVKKYKTVRESNWLHSEEQLLDLTPDDIKAISPRDRITGAAIAFDKVQILSGQPTAIVAYVDMVAGFKELEKQRQAEIDKLGYDPADVVEGEVIEDDLPNAT